MEISKKKLINTLFLLGMPLYGIGFYVGMRQSLSQGMIFSSIPFVGIILVHLVDMLYRHQPRMRYSAVFWISLLALLSMCSGLWLAYLRGFPGYSVLNTSLQCVLVLAPFFAAVVVRIVNRDDPDYSLSSVIFKGLLILMGVNFLGYAAGMHNLVHSFPGRINMPFMRGLYDAAHLLSIIGLMLLIMMRDMLHRPLMLAASVMLFLFGFAVMVNVNSRLSFMVFLVFTLLFMLGVMRNARLAFPISLFTLPLLLSFALLIYEILTLPVFEAVLERVTKEDVTSFNGRSYLWYGAWDWLVGDRRGFFFGNGYNGQAHLGFMKRIGTLWGVEDWKFIHMHSTSLQILLAQGVTGVVLYYASFWHLHRHYRQQYVNNTTEAPLYGAVVYLLFVSQIDIFCYGIDLGVPLITMMLAQLGTRPFQREVEPGPLIT